MTVQAKSTLSRTSIYPRELLRSLLFQILDAEYFIVGAQRHSAVGHSDDSDGGVWRRCLELWDGGGLSKVT